MLCTLLLCANGADGTRVASNFIHCFASSGYPPEREEASRSLVLRALPAMWTAAQWSGESSDREKAQADDYCDGQGHGFFEWVLPLGRADLNRARRIRVLCEASSHRSDTPQTDAQTFPTTLQIYLNDICLYRAVLRNHPHDARGVLSYWRGGFGAYGYLAHTVVEAALIKQIAGAGSNGSLRLRCAVASDALARGGLTLYGAECGRFPICPTVIIEW
jgi:hypothetical protein